MKKIFALGLAIIMMFGIVGCSSSSNTTSDTASTGEAAVMPADMPWDDIEPLSESVTLRVANLANATPHLPTYIAEQKGWLAAVGIEVESVLFTGGPAMMEAVGSWDCGSTGIGGIITGVLNYDIKTLAVAARDEGGFQAFFARQDNPIVAAGTGNGEVAELYGDAESWKGQEILCAVGTTNQFLLYKTLTNFGLTLDDVTVINMESSASNTAFLTGQGDVAGMSGAVVFAEDKADYVMVSSDAWAQTGIVTSFVASPTAWEENNEAVTKWLEVIIMTNEWIMENPEESATYLTEMYAADGYPSTDESNLDLIVNNPFSVLDYQIDIVSQGNTGLSKMHQQTIDALEAYVAMGNYTQEQYDAIVAAADNFPSDAVEAIAARH